MSTWLRRWTPFLSLLVSVATLALTQWQNFTVNRSIATVNQRIDISQQPKLRYTLDEQVDDTARLCTLDVKNVGELPATDISVTLEVAEGVDLPKIDDVRISPRFPVTKSVDGRRMVFTATHGLGSHQTIRFELPPIAVAKDDERFKETSFIEVHRGRPARKPTVFASAVCKQSQGEPDGGGVHYRFRSWIDALAH